MPTTSSTATVAPNAADACRPFLSAVAADSPAVIAAVGTRTASDTRSSHSEATV
jgi:hypothetical protein